MITRKEDLHIYIVNLAVWSGVDQLDKPGYKKKKASITRWNASMGQGYLLMTSVLG